MQRYEVLEKCKENAKKAKQIINAPNINQIVKVMTEPLISRIEIIEKICSVEKYSLCFIGAVGVGKSTAITNLLGLVDDNKINSGYKLKEIPLLKTGEGRTTLCETEIQFINDLKTNIEIKGMDYEEFKDLVEEFCLTILKDSGNDDEKIKCSNEVQRTIRNMSGFPRNNPEKQLAYVKDTLKDEYDEAIEYKKLLKKAILKNIRYKSRTSENFNFDNKEDIKQWIRDTASKINDGEIIDAPYPSKIIIKINTEEFRIEMPRFIERIRDTRGIDGEAVREDIIEACKDINNFCLICDDIKNYGNIVSEGFLKNQFIIKNEDLKYRNFVMGIEQGAQLSKVNEADGRENGKDLKKEEALSNWKNICLDEKNMLFYNSFFGIKYESEEQEILRVDLEKYINERSAILKTIENKLNEMYESYGKELSDINKQLQSFYKNSIEDKHENKLIEIQKSIQCSLLEVKDNYDLFFDRLEKEITSTTAAGTIRATVRRNGVFENYNLYSQAKEVSFEEFDETCKRPLYYLEKETQRIFDNRDIMDEALEKAITYKISELFNKYREANAKDYHDILKMNIYQDSCWGVMQKFWGNKIPGIKYRDRVADALFTTIKNKSILNLIIQKRNTYKFFEELNSFVDFT